MSSTSLPRRRKSLVLSVFALPHRLAHAVPAQRQTLLRVTSDLIGSLAAFWVIERIAAF